MKSFKGGYTQDQVDAIKAHQKGQETAENVRETAKVMLELANGKVEDIKNVTEEQIKVALEEKKNMEKKIQEIMNNEELKAKITENVDKFKETLNNLKDEGLKLAMEKLEQGKAAAEYAKEKGAEVYEKVFSEENEKRAREGMEDAAKFTREKLGDAKQTASETYEKVFSAENKEKVEKGMKNLGDKLSKGANLFGNMARGAFGTKKNLPPGINVTGKEGGKRKNKTKKLTKKEKKMKKARK